MLSIYNSLNWLKTHSERFRFSWKYQVCAPAYHLYPLHLMLVSIILRGKMRCRQYWSIHIYHRDKNCSDRRTEIKRKALAWRLSLVNNPSLNYHSPFVEICTEMRHIQITYSEDILYSRISNIYRIKKLYIYGLL